ncbi:hypothetical protein QTP70_000758 [Hemibagrus guttatus]|uniref:Reverse transcriptase domain-containing protein n=1 Tax=Hemibagrus guttatus TaxID=175788 RepID=A0AAE0QRV9_9TELE|nr:hypothetical protein QTP70_000758 [Hemibagrus guttatus]
MIGINIASLNINGEKEQNKRAKLYGLLKQKHIDDVMLQETHSDISNAADWVKEWDGLVILSHNTSLSGGVALLFARNFIPCSYSVEEILTGRLLKVKAFYENEVLVFICVYTPTSAVERMGFLDTLSNVIADCDTADILILGGDFNCTMDDLDRNHAEPHVASRKRLWEVKEAHKLSDIWRTFNKDKRQYMWAHAIDNSLSLARQYTLNVTRDIVRSLKALEIEIVELQRLEATGNRGHIEALKNKKAKMNDLLDITAQGAKKNGQKRFIHAVRTESGDLLSESTEIRKQTVSFYSKLYSSEWSGAQVVEDSFLVGLPKLSERAARELDRELLLEELHEALQRMENGRASGIDGLPAEFNKAFWAVIGQDVLDVLRDSIRRGELPLSCRRAVLTLLPKKGDLTHLKIWSPVSLLCTYCKLLSKALASRLTKVMEQLIHQDQMYCVPDRSIFDNVYLVRDILHVSRLLGLKTGLIFLDQEKAFDRVEHEYLWKVLETFGFNPGFIGMIRVLYCEIESVLKVNGGLCAPFKVLRGIRQGCALSGMLYTLAIEPLLNKLRSHLSGFKVPHTNASICLSAYADDLVLMIDSQKDMNVLTDILNDFQVLSSAKVNWAKSEAILVGEWGGERPTLPGGLVWKKDGFKYLGVYLGNNQYLNKNWEGSVEHVKGKLSRWKRLVPRMSYRGRTLVINNLAASFLWHKLACVDPPPNLLASIQALLVDFFWDGLHWIPQSVLHLPKEEGGQGLVQLASRTAAFRLQFLQRLLIGPKDLIWRPVAHGLLHKVGGLGLD